MTEQIEKQTIMVIAKGGDYSEKTIRTFAESYMKNMK